MGVTNGALDPNGSGSLGRNGNSASRFRETLLAVQVCLYLTLPIAGFCAEVFTAELPHPWQLTPVWERLYYLGIVIPSLIGQGLLRAPEMIQALQAWRGQKQQN